MSKKSTNPHRDGTLRLRVPPCVDVAATVSAAFGDAVSVAGVTTPANVDCKEGDWTYMAARTDQTRIIDGSETLENNGPSKSSSPPWLLYCSPVTTIH